MIFTPLIKGLIDWHLKYNKDIGGLCDEMNNAKSDGIINTYTHSKSGTNHTLTGAGAIMRFTARAPWIAGDTVTVNGTRLNPLNLEGKPLPAGAFVAGMQVVAIQDGQNLQFLTQSYVEQFASINSQMENKANMSEPLAIYRPTLTEYFTDKDANRYVFYTRNQVSIIYIHFEMLYVKKSFDGINVTIFTLPVGFRPYARCYTQPIVQAGKGPGQSNDFNISVNTRGVVTMWTASSNYFTGDEELGFDAHIIFPAA